MQCDLGQVISPLWFHLPYLSLGLLIPLRVSGNVDRGGLAQGLGQSELSIDYYYFCYMISEKDLTNSQNIPYEERIARIEKMIESEEEPKAFELGLLLALKMGQEIREKKPLGSTTGDIVAAWSSKYSESVVEEAIAHAKQFLTNPGALAEKMKNIMLKKMNSPDEENKAEEAQGGK